MDTWGPDTTTESSAATVSAVSTYALTRKKSAVRIRQHPLRRLPHAALEACNVSLRYPHFGEATPTWSTTTTPIHARMVPAAYESSLMSGNSIFTMTDTAIVTVTHVDAPEVVTSAHFDEVLTDTYERVGALPGMLQRIAGIQERRWWPEGHLFTDAAAAAGAKAIEGSGVRVEDIGLLIDTSVCRDRLEPSSAVTVHNTLGLSSSCLSFDLSNACLGFVNALQVAGNMISSGQIDYALIVDGEGSRLTQETTLARLTRPDVTLDILLAEFATLTLGSGGAAAVIGRHSDNPGSHKVVRGVARADSSHHDLCVGDLTQMRTDSRGLLDAGLHISKLVWGGVDQWGWMEADRYIVHQVSQIHTRMTCDVLGIDRAKIPLTFPFLGNVGPASIPITLSLETESLDVGDTVLLMGIGSGINTSVIELLW